MAQREYQAADSDTVLPDHDTMNGLIDKIKSMFRAHHVEVDRDSNKVVVHVSDEEMYPHIDEALMDIGFIPGMGVQ